MKIDKNAFLNGLFWPIEESDGVYAINSDGVVVNTKTLNISKHRFNDYSEFVRLHINGKRIDRSVSVLIENKGKSRPRGRLTDEELFEKSKKLWEEGYPLIVIKKKLHVDAQRLRTVLKNSGVKITQGFQNSKCKSPTPIACYRRLCMCCKKPFETHIYNKKYCSSKCRENNRILEKEFERIRKPYFKKLDLSRRRKNKIKVSFNTAKQKRVCHYCLKEYKTNIYKQKYCSTHCRQKARVKRQFKKRGRTKVSLYSIYKRDKGLCYICGRQTDPDDYKIVNGHKITGNNYPSRDHIVPLSNGGKDISENIKLACRLCNSYKRDLGLSEAQRIIKKERGVLC